MSVSLFAIEGIAQDSAKNETKVLSENGKPSLITFNEKINLTDSQKYSRNN
jgi:hypothetical protein